MRQVFKVLPLLALITMLLALWSEKKRIPYPFKSSPNDGSFCSRPELTDWLEVYKRTACFPMDFSGRLEGQMGPEVKRDQ